MGFYDEEFTIATTADRVYRRFDNPHVNEEIKDWANDQLRSIQPDLDRVLDFDNGYRDFLLDYMSTEVDRFPDERSDPICTCDDLGCVLKDGRLPRQVVTADTIEDGIKRYKQTHGGTPQVLIDGAEKWRQKRRNVWYVLRHIETHMTEDRTEVPDDPDPAIDGEDRQTLPGD